MQEDCPGSGEHDNEYLNPDITQSDSPNGEEDVHGKLDVTGVF
jgi:hypothetical protein